MLEPFIDQTKLISFAVEDSCQISTPFLLVLISPSSYSYDVGHLFDPCS
mgnify:CR=1 FL=1